MGGGEKLIKYGELPGGGGGGGVDSAPRRQQGGQVVLVRECQRDHELQPGSLRGAGGRLAGGGYDGEWIAGEAAEASPTR